jgi:response regulator RpfG family c-di-GMP phosphodiesterase
MPDRSILVVDDNEINRGILAEIFKDKYNVLEAGNGLEAIKMMEENDGKLAAILLDIVMPEMDGYAVLEEMEKRDNLNERIPVLMITADTSTEAERTSYQKGAADVIHKPFDPVIVDRRVSRNIELYDHKNNLESQIDDQTRVLKKQFIYLKKQEEKLKNSNEKVIGMFIRHTQVKQLPTFLVVGLVIVIDFIYQHFYKSLQLRFVVEYVFYSFLIHLFSCKGSNQSRKVGRYLQIPGFARIY